MKKTVSAGLAFVVAAMMFGGCGGGEAAEDRMGTTEQGLSTECQDIQDKLNKLRQEVQACSPAGSADQCSIVLDDICCPISANGGPIDDFKELVAMFKDLKCPAYCLAVECQPFKAGVCGLDGRCHP